MNYLDKAKELENELISDYKELHKRAETGFELPETVAYVKKRLDELGIVYTDCGKNGVIGYIGDKRAKESVLLRADMDALPIKEEADVDYKSESGAMHACGHDAHTAMLISAAKLLKESESELMGCVKLMFQPAEELLEGAKSMIENGVLEIPPVKAAIMLHLIVGTELQSGSVVISSGGVSAPSADYFRITVKGVGCHGSTPEKGRDPLAVACRALTALDEIKAKELALNERAVISVGSLHSGDAPNAIPEKAELTGSIRAYSENTREYIKQRINNIVSMLAGAFETQCEVDFYSGTPSLLNDEILSKSAYECAKELFTGDRVMTSEELGLQAQKQGKRSEGAGSEDFAYISREAPSLMIALAAGKASEGYKFPLHNSKVRFDTSAFKYGSALLAKIAIKMDKMPKNAAEKTL